MKRIILLIILMLTPVFAQDQSDELVINLSSQQSLFLSGYRYQFGDDPDWSKKEYDDSNWPQIPSNILLKKQKGIHWFRKTLTLRDSIQFTEIAFLRLSYIQTAYDIFWDGIKLGSNGQVGKTVTEEKAGRSITKIILHPFLLTPGSHTLAIRMSNFHGVRPFMYGSCYFGVESQLGYLSRLPWMFKQVFFTGIFFTATIVGFSLFWSGDRYRPFFIFAIICLVTSLNRGLLFLLEYLNLGLNLAGLAWFMHFLFFDLIAAGVIVFLVANFKMSDRKIDSVIIVVTLLLVRIMQIIGKLPSQFYIINATIPNIYILSLLIILVRRKKAGSWFAFAGYLIFIVPRQLSIFLNIQIIKNSWMFAHTIFIMAIILSISKQLQEQARKRKELDTRSQRLENELLKKTIQPHFIMNTLQSIKSLSKRQPEKATELIEAFADEFRVINKVASEKQIFMEEEIQLCDSHLKLMGHRWNARYSLEKEGILLQEKIPPLILHTLIENGLTHSYHPKESGTFQLIRIEKNGTIQYCMRNDGSLLKQLTERSQEEISEGMGYKYVKTRLEESYPGKWSLYYGMKDNLWEVMIEIRK